MTVPENETSSLRESVAAEIRAQLARRRLSGRQAAALLGWTSPYLSRRLTGEVPFDVSDLEAMAALLDVPVASFLQGPPAPVMLGLRTAPIRCGWDDDRDDECCPRCGAVNWGWTPDGRLECVSCGYVDGPPVNLYRSLLGLAA